MRLGEAQRCEQVMSACLQAAAILITGGFREAIAAYGLGRVREHSAADAWAAVEHLLRVAEPAMSDADAVDGNDLADALHAAMVALRTALDQNETPGSEVLDGDIAEAALDRLAELASTFRPITKFEEISPVLGGNDDDADTAT
jgi:hypothetical protein